MSKNTIHHELGNQQSTLLGPPTSPLTSIMSRTHRTPDPPKNASSSSRKSDPHYVTPKRSKHSQYPYTTAAVPAKFENILEEILGPKESASRFSNLKDYRDLSYTVNAAIKGTISEMQERKQGRERTRGRRRKRPKSAAVASSFSTHESIADWTFSSDAVTSSKEHSRMHRYHLRSIPHNSCDEIPGFGSSLHAAKRVSDTCW